MKPLNRILSPIERASIEAHKKLSDKGLSYYSIFRAGAKWLAEKAEEWLNGNAEYYEDDEGVDSNALTLDFQRAMENLLNSKN